MCLLDEPGQNVICGLARYTFCLASPITTYTQNAMLSTSCQNRCHQNSFMVVIQKAVTLTTYWPELFSHGC